MQSDNHIPTTMTHPMILQHKATITDLQTGTSYEVKNEDEVALQHRDAYISSYKHNSSVQMGMICVAPAELRPTPRRI